MTAAARTAAPTLATVPDSPPEILSVPHSPGQGCGHPGCYRPFPAPSGALSEFTVVLNPEPDLHLNIGPH